jgi:hypothetical protein
MSFSYNMGANPVIDYPRLIIADTDSTHAIFQDEEIMSAYNIDSMVMFIPVGQGSPVQVNTAPSARRAAATLLDSLASNKARLASALMVLDIKIDSTKAAKELRDSAKALRDTEADSGNFAITEMVQTQWAARERVWKQLLRIFGG